MEFGHNSAPLRHWCIELGQLGDGCGQCVTGFSLNAISQDIQKFSISSFVHLLFLYFFVVLYFAEKYTKFSFRWM